MKLVTPPLIVAENDSFANDALDRKSYGEALLNIAVRSSEALVISLDGKWGEGKTTFVKMWQGLLSEANIPNIYIDAFANDYVDDAFISIASAITTYAEAHTTKENKKRIDELKEKTKQVGGQLLSWSARMGIKAATLGVLSDTDIDELKEIKGDLSTGFSDVVGDFIEERISSHSKDIDLIKSFRHLLSSLPSQLQEENAKPLVVIIDELDRCKPTFAIEIVEKIKHLFSVENVVFLLVMNKSQLEESIRSVYGREIDAHIYLQKFVNLEAKLPKRTSERNNTDLSKYTRRLLQLHELQTWEEDKLLVDSADLLANHFNLSLRQLEKVFTNLAVFYASSSENDFRLVPLIVFLAVVKVVDANLFDDLLHQEATYREVSNKLNLSSVEESSKRPKRLFQLMQLARFYLLSEQEFSELAEEDEIQYFGRELRDFHLDREQVVPYFAEQLSMFAVN